MYPDSYTEFKYISCDDEKLEERISDLEEKVQQLEENQIEVLV